MEVAAEVSVYPVGEPHLVHPVQAFVSVLKEHGCEVEVGPMSTIVKGESSDIFEALRVGYERACDKGGFLLTVKACNVCPV